MTAILWIGFVLSLMFGWAVYAIRSKEMQDVLDRDDKPERKQERVVVPATRKIRCDHKSCKQVLFSDTETVDLHMMGSIRQFCSLSCLQHFVGGDSVAEEKIEYLTRIADATEVMMGPLANHRDFEILELALKDWNEYRESLRNG